MNIFVFEGFLCLYLSDALPNESLTSLASNLLGGTEEESAKQKPFSATRRYKPWYYESH